MSRVGNVGVQLPDLQRNVLVWVLEFDGDRETTSPTYLLSQTVFSIDNHRNKFMKFR